MRKMILAAASLLTLASGSAFAADLRMPVKAPAAYVAETFNWSGFYLGVQGGYGWGTVGNAFTIGGVTTPQPRYNARGGFVGGHAGYNVQYGMWVFGLETDAEWSGVRGNDGGIGGVVDSLAVRWQGSTRGRLGVAVDRALIYATGGVAYAGTDYSLTSGAFTETHRNTLVGWTAGAGVEYSFAPSWSARLEYRYSDYGGASPNFVGGPGVAPQRIDYDYRTHAVRAGISYRFNSWGGPVVARY